MIFFVFKHKFFIFKKKLTVLILAVYPVNIRRMSRVNPMPPHILSWLSKYHKIQCRNDIERGVYAYWRRPKKWLAQNATNHNDYR